MVMQGREKPKQEKDNSIKNLPVSEIIELYKVKSN
jgi:hypothetical protein